MTEPENFEEDLFADLYDDNDAAKGAPAPPPVAPVNDATDDGGDAAASAAHNTEDAAGDADMTHEAEDDDDDDEVDFNLGGGSTVAAPLAQHDDTPSTPPYGTVHKASAKEDGKMFIGGLNWETTDLESLRDYFSQFGEVVECTVMRDSSTGRSRGFGFLTFKDAKTVNIVMVKEHFLDGKIIDPKRAIPRDEQEKTSKIFVGGVSQETTDQEFRDYFAQFGRVVDATLMMDKDTGRPRGFGFVTFESEAGVDACINVPLEIHGKPVEVKKAQPRGNLREEEEAAKRNKFRKDEQSGQGGMGAGQQMGGGANGMTPQLMAQYFQRMQQYFAMMQSQMAMNRGMQMNPAMWQQMMQMQQMQQQMMAGRGGGGGGGQGASGNNPQAMMGNMNPQMMQQMQQQMMQMQQQQQGGGQQQPQGGDQGNYGAGAGSGFQQAPPQGPAGGGRRGGGGRGGYGGGGGGGGGYGMGGGGAPTSWEGMYDDVPQPSAGQGGFRRGGGGSQGTPDPQNAPPANAPTGPKNAGRPGANYRGGGRGGNRGFHPYAR
ncbi:heterogeneous nuclear ribonucleoprotein HRP1 [Purpureocillium lavendulum]|uniref:Heterogeneous nuclear ribonucleoprotein HRP1 n=1 Tax=Purpureocillium lavendulum TaxID=1247861 RepID=A0AB34FWK0_9HYPO|nr:heterogeneous nuclear ribonucleoprotein HRP1 [Purpureocillium lavendulum]